MGWDPPRLRWTAASSKNAAEDRNAADRRTCIAALGGIVGVATMATVKVLRQSSVAFCGPSTSAASLPPASVAADSSQDAGRSCASRQRGGAGLRLAGNKVRQTSACQRQGRSGTATFARRATTFLDHRLRKARRSIGIKPIIARPAIVGGMKSVDMPLTRLQSAIPRGDDLDKSILKIGLPSIANLLIFPFVSAVDTFWVGRMGDPLALAGQGAANQVFSSVFWVIAFLPSVTTPLVARAAAAGDKAEARRRVCEAAFLAVLMGSVGAMLLGLCTPFVLRLVLPPDAPARAFAEPYLRIRALSFIPALLSTVGFAAFRGVLDTVTPLRVAAVSNLINVSMDPVLMFKANMGMPGAAGATVICELTSGIAYMVLLFRRKLMSWRGLLSVPSLSRLAPLLKGGLAVQLRSLALNAAFLTATAEAQRLDSSGVAAAAYAISMQFWNLGGVVLYALQGCAAILVPSEFARKDGGGWLAARNVADRLLLIGLVLGVAIGCVQLSALPLLKAFSTVPNVRSAAVGPVAIASFMSVIAGVVFAGEGIMMGRGAWGALALQTALAAVTMMTGIHVTARCGLGLAGVWLSISAFNIVNLSGVLWHHLWANRKPLQSDQKDDAHDSSSGDTEEDEQA